MPETVTADDCLAYYRDVVLHLPVARVPDFVPGPVTVAFRRALLDVAAIFGGNGFTAAQVTAWTGYASVIKMQTVFWMIASGALLDNPENQRALNATLKLLDQREQLGTMYPDENGQPVIPGRILTEVGFGPSKIMPAEPFRDDRTQDWRRM